MHSGLTALNVSHNTERMESCMQNRPFSSEWFCPNGGLSGLAVRALLLGCRLLLSQRSQSLTHLVLCNTRTAGSLPLFYAFTALPWAKLPFFTYTWTLTTWPAYADFYISPTAQSMLSEAESVKLNVARAFCRLDITDRSNPWRGSAHLGLTRLSLATLFWHGVLHEYFTDLFIYLLESFY